MGKRIAAIIHEYDRLYRRRLFRRPESTFLLSDVLNVLRQRGWTVQIARGVSRPIDADAAVMHVDATHVPEAYLAYGRRYPICLNGRVADISKSLVSDAVLARSDSWAGPVIIKTDLNFRGAPEALKNRSARRRGRPLPFPDAGNPRNYQVVDAMDQVPAAVWEDRALVVERFLPEKLSDGYGMCHYVFCGDYEFCARYVGNRRQVKASNIFRYDLIEVPQAIRDRRAALAFDFGKFDFVEHDGRYYLVDANKTCGVVPEQGGASIAGLAEGFVGLVEAR